MLFFITFLIMMQSCIHDSIIYNRNIAYDNSQIPDCNPQELGPQMIRIPGFEIAWQIVPDCFHFSRKKTAIALSIFYHHWVVKFHDPHQRVFHALNNILIEWSHAEKYIHGYTEDGVLRDNGRALGLTLTPTIVWIKIPNTPQVCKTGLIHELVHVALLANNQCGDADHEGNQYYGWSRDHTEFIDNDNMLLCGLDI
ncbi:hypothetical protein CL614_09480 [archaeon]|nr:hypothetical protein [archaeon]